MSKKNKYVSEVKYAKAERKYLKGLRMKPLRQQAARAERRAAKADLRDYFELHAD